MAKWDKKANRAWAVNIGLVAMCCWACGAQGGQQEAQTKPEWKLERISTGVPFPRGLAVVPELGEGKLVVLARGRVRSSGGVSAAVEDRAGTLFVVDTHVAEVWSGEDPVEAVRLNASVLAEPTSPPFMLWDRTSDPPEVDVRTDRPYCVLRYDAQTQSLFICAFSGVDLNTAVPGKSFSKNETDAIFRYDLRQKTWSEIERHKPGQGYAEKYANPDMATLTEPTLSTRHGPKGLLKGPNNLVISGRWLIGAGKENSVMAAYSLDDLQTGPTPLPREYPRSMIVWTETVKMADGSIQTHLGPSALVVHEGWLYIGYRTTGGILRVRLEENGLIRPESPAELVAQFTPFDREKIQTADITDMAFDKAGNLVVLSAEPAKLYRFRPDPKEPYVAVNRPDLAFADVAGMTKNLKTKCENLLIDEAGRIYLTSGDGYGYQSGAAGTVYRLTELSKPQENQP